MSPLLELVSRAKKDGDWRPLVSAIPYAAFLGIELDASQGELLVKLRYGDHLVGNSSLPALHGGAMGALLESAAIFAVVWEAEAAMLPKTITITVDYLRPARPIDTWARAVIARQGRRVASVRAEAWQEDRSKPVAVATTHLLLPSDDSP